MDESSIERIIILSVRESRPVDSKWRSRVCRLSPVSNEFRRGVAVTFILDNDREREQSGPAVVRDQFSGPLSCTPWRDRASNYDFGVIIYARLSGRCPRSQYLINRPVLSLKDILWSAPSTGPNSSHRFGGHFYVSVHLIALLLCFSFWAVFE